MDDKQTARERAADFWSKGVTVSGDQLKRIFDTLKWDLATFRVAYATEIAKGHDELAQPDAETINAVTQFQEKGDYAELMTALGTDHPLIVDHAVTSVIRYQHTVPCIRS